MISMTSISGFLLVLSAGVFWAVLGIVVAFGKSCNAPSALVQPFAGILILVFAGWTALLAEPFHWNAAVIIQILLILIVGICNYFMLNLVQLGMRSGREGVVWAFTQSSMICPFALGMLFFRETASVMRIGGLLLILTSLALFAFARKEDTACATGWLAPTAGAFLISGTAQSCASVPSYFQLPGMTPLRRMLFLQTGILLAFLFDHLLRQKTMAFRNRNAWLFAVVFAGSNLIGLICFYTGQDLLANAKGAAISYPAAQGVSIALVFLFGCLKTAPGRMSWGAFTALMGGIILLAA